MVVYGGVVYITNLKVAIFSNTYTPLSVGIILGSILIYYLIFIPWSLLWIEPDIYNSFAQLSASGYYYFVVILQLTAICMLELAYIRVKNFGT